MAVVWCRGISEMFGDVWDRGGVKWMLRSVYEMVGVFGKKNIDWKWVEECTQISIICVDGVR